MLTAKELDENSAALLTLLTALDHPETLGHAEVAQFAALSRDRYPSLTIAGDTTAQQQALINFKMRADQLGIAYKVPDAIDIASLFATDHQTPLLQVKGASASLLTEGYSQTPPIPRRPR